MEKGSRESKAKQSVLFSVLSLILMFLVIEFNDVCLNEGFGEDELYEELWRGCAGPLVDVPRIGERVFYFPQGHIEQVLLLF